MVVSDRWCMKALHCILCKPLCLLGLGCVSPAPKGLASREVEMLTRVSESTKDLVSGVLCHVVVSPPSCLEVHCVAVISLMKSC